MLDFMSVKLCKMFLKMKPRESILLDIHVLSMQQASGPYTAEMDIECVQPNALLEFRFPYVKLLTGYKLRGTP